MPKKNKSNNKRSHKTKSGAASFYIIIFTTILFGIITLSFIRIILSESSQTSNNDLSQSAYDSALAGIEDAKIAILDYHKCINIGKSVSSSFSNELSKSLSGESCTKYVEIIQQAIEKQDCDITLKALKRHNESENKKEVLIQETASGNSQGTSASTDLQQAYTCVKIKEELPDYRSVLDSENRTRIVPIRTKDYDSINRVKFSWYSSVNVNANNTNTSGDKKFHPNPNNDTPYAPPVVAFQLLQTNKAFGLNELSVTNDDSGGNGAGVDRSTIFLRPLPQLKDNPAENIIQKKALLDGADKSLNEPIDVECSKPNGNKEFLCSAFIEIPRPAQTNNIRNNSSFFVRVSLPYGTPATDFSIELEGTDSAGQSTPVNFYGVQTAIDSTGRANDLYRRVESRVELVDTHFPYPEFAIEIIDDGDGSKVLKKNFRVTKNCWTSDGYGQVSACPNNEELE